MSKPRKIKSRPGTVKALLDAYERLSAGTAQDGTSIALTIENVSIEAGVGRATAYRCDDLVRLFKPSNPAANASEPTAEEGPTVEKEPTVEEDSSKASTERELRRLLRIACNRIVLEHERRIALEQEVLRLRLRCGEAVDNVVPIRPL